MQSSRPSHHTMLGAGLRAATIAIGLVLLAGCNGESAMDEAGATLSGRIRLAPLREPPPAGRVTVQVLPFTGLPVTIADAIYHSFRTEAARAGITLVHRLEEPATWRVQGHFVALGQATSSTIVFTWDIYDAAGHPVHRIVGQELAGGADGDAWSAVDSGVEDRLAKRAVRELQSWLSRDVR